MTLQSEQAATLHSAALSRGPAEKLIYADFLEEQGDAELAAVIRCRVELDDLPEHRIWSGERVLPEPFHSALRPVAAPLDFAPANRLLPLLADVARSRPHDAAARDLAEWYPAAAEAVATHQLGWETLRHAAFERRARELDAAGRNAAARYVRRRRSEVVWELRFGQRVAWGLHPALVDYDGEPQAVAHWIEDVALGRDDLDADDRSAGESNAPESSIERPEWPAAEGHWSRFRPVGFRCSVHPPRPREVVERLWRYGAAIVERLAEEGAVSLFEGARGWPEQFSLVDEVRCEEYDEAQLLFGEWSGGEGDSARRRAILNEAGDAVRAAHAVWLSAVSIARYDEPLAAAKPRRPTRERRPDREPNLNRAGARSLLRWVGM